MKLNHRTQNPLTNRVETILHIALDRVRGTAR